jgi:hypothetical protein
LLFTYKLAREFLSKEKAILSVALLSFFPAFSVRSYVFNHDLLIILPYIASLYYYYKFLKKNTFLYAIMFGLFIGLGFMSKYFFIIPATCFVIHSLLFAKQYKNIKLYMAGFTALLICLPNIYWLFENNFLPVEYTKDILYSGKSGFVSGVKFILEETTYLLALIFSLAVLIQEKPSFNKFKDSIMRPNFISFFIISTCLALFLFTSFTEIRGRSRFLYPFMTLFPIYALMLFKEVPYKKFKSIFLWLISGLIIFYIIEAVKIVNAKKDENIDYEAFAKQIEEKWKERCGNSKPINYILSKTHYGFGSAVIMHLKPTPHFVPYKNFKFTPYLKEENYKSEGGVTIDLIKNEKEISSSSENNSYSEIWKIPHKRKNIFFQKNAERTFEVEFNCGKNDK